MTIFTIVSIVLALCGATYTALSQITAALTKRVEAWTSDTIQSVKQTEGLARSGTKPIAWSKRRLVLVKLALALWNLSIFPPIIALSWFAFSLAFEVLDTINGPVAASQPTTDSIQHYHGCLKCVIWTNVASLVIKMASFVIIWLIQWFQRSCQTHLQSANPSALSNILPDSIGPLESPKPGP